MTRPTTLFSAGLLALAALGLSSCEEDRAQVTVVPSRDGSFTRTLRLFKIDTEKPDEVLEPTETFVAAALLHYDDSSDADAPAVVFSGSFREVPPDIAVGEQVNRGGYSVWDSKLGWFAVYRERRPGPTDFGARYEKAAAGADRAADLLVSVARRELAGEEGLELLLAFLEVELRRDLKDVLFLLSSSGGGRETLSDEETWTPPPFSRIDRGDSNRPSSAAAMVIQILAERSYLEVKDLPRLVTEEHAPEMLMRQVAARMGRPLDEGLRRKLRALGDEDGWEAAVEKSRAELGWVEQEMKESFEALGDPLTQLDLGGRDRLEFVLVPPAGAEVVSTSGTGDPASGIRMRDRLDDSPVKSIFFVTFSVPDSEWQQTHFGGTVLSGARLRDYLLWLDRLPPEQAAAWEAAMEGVAPGPELWNQIRAIRVTGDDDVEEGARIFAEAYNPEPR